MTDEVRGDHSADARQRRHDVAPKVTGSGVAVQQHDGVTLAHLNMGEAMTQNAGELFGWHMSGHASALRMRRKVVSMVCKCCASGKRRRLDTRTPSLNSINMAASS